jgi:hypothetical protein
MSVIGYSQLMKDIFEVNTVTVEKQMERLAKHKLTELRFGAIRMLAKHSRGTISGLLKKVSCNHTGGTYKTVATFFEMLLGENILVREKAGNRNYWRFSEGAKDLENYLKS